MRINISVDCDNCLKTYETDMDADSRSACRDAGRIRSTMGKDGWFVGFNMVYCPECFKHRVESNVNCRRCVHSSYHTGQLYCKYGDLEAYEHAVSEEEHCKHFNEGEQK